MMGLDRASVHDPLQLNLPWCTARHLLESLCLDLSPFAGLFWDRVSAQQARERKRSYMQVSAIPGLYTIPALPKPLCCVLLQCSGL